MTQIRAADLGDEVERYLAAPLETPADPLVWWHERRTLYPNLSRMALDYLTIPGTSTPCYICTSNKSNQSLNHQATSVNVERVFSLGRLLLSHTRSRMAAQTTRALLCLGAWSKAGYVKSTDLRKTAQLLEVDGDASDFEMEEGWDAIDLASIEA